MANTKISQLPVATSTTAPDLYTIVQGGINKSVTFAILQAAIGSSGGGLNQLTGDVVAGPGTGSQVARLVATSNNTLVTLSALQLPYSQLIGTVPTWNQDTTGNAATATYADSAGTATIAGNITATTNSTLTTLSALSLPYSQLSGTVPTWNQDTTGSAASFTGPLLGDVTGTQGATALTATTNNTLVTLSALNLPFTQLSGQATLAQLPTIAGNTILGNNSGSASTPIALTAAQVAAMLGYVTAVGTYNGQPAVANGASINTNSIFFQSASATVPGMVDNATQTFSGNKTFSGQTAISNTSTSALAINGTSFIFDATNNAFGIGIQPSAAVMIDGVNASGASKLIQMTGYGVGSTVGYRGRFARGTSTSPLAVNAGDILSVFSGRGYGLDQFATASTGVINIVAGETFTDVSNMTYLQFLTTPTGSVTSAEAMRIASTGVTLGPQSGSTATHQINGAIQVTQQTITAATYTVDSVTTDNIIFTDSTSNAIAITLPPPTSGRELTIADKTGMAGTHNITILQNASETINGLTKISIAQAYGAITLTSDGTNWSAQAVPTSGHAVFTSGTTFTTAANITPQTRFKITCVGGGGGGGGIDSSNEGAAGGGSGSVGIVWLTGLAPSTSYTYAVGAGGAGGANTGSTAGGNGGATSITINAVTYIAGGGDGAPAKSGNTDGGGGSVPSTFSINFISGNGGSCSATAGVASGAGGSPALYGIGGASVCTSANGINGRGFGGGGGGAHGTGAGGNGIQGCIIIEWYT